MDLRRQDLPEPSEIEKDELEKDEDEPFEDDIDFMKLAWPKAELGSHALSFLGSSSGICYSML